MTEFPNDECRLLCLDGLPKATNAQERFLMSKMGASALFNERLQTRVLQAAGRCTRALQDRSAVFITGHELQDYLADDRNWRHFHPELQAELAFGVYQSKETKPSELMASFRSFIANDSDWDEANSQIVDDAATKHQAPYPAMDELEKVVTHEVGYQKALWGDDLDGALLEARAITAELTAPELRGYRALWYYLAGSVNQMLSIEAGDGHDRSAREQFASAKAAAPSVPWLSLLTRSSSDASESTDPQHSVEVTVQVEKLEAVLLGFGTVSDHKFEKHAKLILESLQGEKQFEEGQRLLGSMLGFDAGNDESDAAPDPWWLGHSIGLVFEDHAASKSQTILGARKAKQAALHPNWVQDNVPEAANLKLSVALVTPCLAAGAGAKPSLKLVRYWQLDDFRNWAKNAIDVIRSLKGALPPGSDLIWRIDAANKLVSAGLDLQSIIESLAFASDQMTFQQKK